MWAMAFFTICEIQCNYVILLLFFKFLIEKTVFLKSLTHCQFHLLIKVNY